jgi:soluble lytic murein transglycosylase-like protein
MMKKKKNLKKADPGALLNPGDPLKIDWHSLAQNFDPQKLTSQQDVDAIVGMFQKLHPQGADLLSKDHNPLPLPSEEPDPTGGVKKLPTREGILGGLALADMLLPPDRIHNPVVRPLMTPNPHSNGTGSEAIYATGGQVEAPGNDPYHSKYLQYLTTGKMPYSVMDPEYKKFQGYLQDQAVHQKAHQDAVGPYKPTPAQTQIKAALSTATALNPTVGLVTGPLGSGTSIYTGTRYAMDGQWGNALQDYGEAVVDLIPGVNSVYKKINRSAYAASRAYQWYNAEKDIFSAKKQDGTPLVDTTAKKAKFDLGGPLPGSHTGGDELTKKYGQYVQDRQGWLQLAGKKLGGATARDMAVKAAQQTGLNPAMLYASAMEEGMNLRYQKPDEASEAYNNASRKDKAMSQYPVDGFLNYGLDTFGDAYPTLVKKGYLPQDFQQKFHPYQALNEKKQAVNTAAFQSDSDALQAKAAMMALSRDQVVDYAKKQKLALSPEATDFFTMASYNGGQGNAQKMLGYFQKNNLLKDNAFLKTAPQKYRQIYDHVMHRYQGAQMLHGEGVFADGGQVGGDTLHIGEEGAAVPLSQNPYDGGTLEFVGPSHADGGIPMQYGSHQIEVEGKETAVKDAVGNLHIMGNLKVPGTNKKFKDMSKELARSERKAQKQKSAGEQLLQGLTGADPNDVLRQNASQLTILGADAKQKSLAQKKQDLAGLQQAILEASEHLGVEPSKLLKKAKNGMTLAANGLKTPPGLDPATVAQLAQQYGVDPTVIQKLISQESQNDSQARSNRGALGIMQLMPETAKKYGLSKKQLTSSDPEDMKKVVSAGIQEFAALTKRNGGDTTLALAAYNGGQGAVDYVKKKLGKSSITGEQWLHFMQQRHNQSPSANRHAWQNETLDYVKNIATPHSDEEFNHEAQKFNRKYYTPALPTQTPHTTPGLTPLTPQLRQLPKAPPEDPKKEADTPVDTTYQGHFNLQPFDRGASPSNVEPLKLEQYAPELVATALNHPQAVWMQQYQPQYLQPYQVSYQDAVNQNNAQLRGYERMFADDPSVMGAMAAQTYEANSRVLGEQFRQNQQIEADTINKNVGIANDAQLKNLSLADTQYVRQQEALSKTRALNQEALSSVSSKLLQNNLENRRLAAYENLYDYRFQDTDGDGVPETLRYLGPEAQFNFDPSYQPTQDGYQTITKKKYGPYGQDAGYEVTNKELIPQGQTTSARKGKKGQDGTSLTSLYNQMVAKLR